MQYDVYILLSGGQGERERERETLAKYNQYDVNIGTYIKLRYSLNNIIRHREQEGPV